MYSGCHEDIHCPPPETGEEGYRCMNHKCSERDVGAGLQKIDRIAIKTKTCEVITSVQQIENWYNRKCIFYHGLFTPVFNLLHSVLIYAISRIRKI